MKYLITGSAGHLGEALMRTLRGRDKDAVGLDVKPSPFTDIVGSIANRDVVKHAMTGVQAVIHTATLHKPHVATHTRQDFVDVNITGTLNLLEEALAANLRHVVFTSTTSVYSNALKPPPGAPAVWVDEDLTPAPKNIYGITKIASEQIAELLHRKYGLPCVVLRTSRFFPEVDDDPDTRAQYSDANVKVNEYLYRRVDVEDVVQAHLLAAEKAPAIGFARYVVSATTPFTRADAARLHLDAAAVVRERVPQYAEEYERRGWRMFPQIARVYDNSRARADLGWHPHYDFAHVVRRLREGEDFRSPLAQAIGSKGYHRKTFSHGPYPVD